MLASIHQLSIQVSALFHLLSCRVAYMAKALAVLVLGASIRFSEAKSFGSSHVSQNLLGQTFFLPEADSAELHTGLHMVL